MERFLDDYINRMRHAFPEFPASTAHEMASAFLAFKFGLYTNAVRECMHASLLISDGEANECLKKALAIIRMTALDRDNSRITEEMTEVFSENDRKFLAINIPLEKIEDPGTLNLDNALILIYVVALITSPDDEDALEEHRRLIVRMLNDYKKALGLE